MFCRMVSWFAGVALFLVVALSGASLSPNHAVARLDPTLFTDTHDDHDLHDLVLDSNRPLYASLEELPGPLGAPAGPVILEPLARTERVQFVLVSMDATPRGGDADGEFFHKFHERIKDHGNATFTLFINTGFLQLHPASTPPRDSLWSRDAASWNRFLGTLPRNRPSIRYSENPEEILGRAHNLQSLARLGVEIGSHGVRHADGRTWTTAQWHEEFTDHQRVLDLLGLPEPVGIRAPFLGTSDGFWTALEERGMRYDTSRTAGARREWPERVDGTHIWEVKVPSVVVHGRGTIFFDLNLKNNLKVSDSEYFEIAMREFNARYHGSRAPFLMSGHGNYSRAMTRVMKKVCVQPKVRCGTFAELADYMDAHPEMSGAD